MRSAVMTGCYSCHNGLVKSITANGHPYVMPLNQTTIAKELKMGGYTTQH